MNEETSTPIASRIDFQNAIRVALEQAAATGATEIFLVDPDFSDWPLNERAVVDALARWAGPLRQLLILGHSFDEMARRQARFLEWRRQWNHLVQCRSNEEAEATQVPTLLLIPGLVAVRLHDQIRYRGLVSGKPVDLAECREAIDALLQRSVEAFPVTTLGL